MKGTRDDRSPGFVCSSLFAMLVTPGNHHSGLPALPMPGAPRIEVAEHGRAIARDAERDGPAGVQRHTWNDFQELLKA